MKKVDLKKYLFKYLVGNTNGTSIENLIDFLDYIDRVIYEYVFIENILEEFIKEEKIYKNKNLYYIR